VARHDDAHHAADLSGYNARDNDLFTHGVSNVLGVQDVEAVERDAQFAPAQGECNVNFLP
jgi:hypothetical protein